MMSLKKESYRRQRVSACAFEEFELLIIWSFGPHCYCLPRGVPLEILGGGANINQDCKGPQTNMPKNVGSIKT